MDDEYADLRWFDKFGKCSCGANATGNLMNSRNEKWARACDRCAQKRLKASKKLRDDLAKKWETLNKSPTPEAK